MLSERSSRKKTFMPSCGRFHCRPAMARVSANTIMNRSANAVHRRHALICTSDFQVSQTVQGTAGTSSNNHTGLVNWKFMLVSCQSSVVSCQLSVVSRQWSVVGRSMLDVGHQLLAGRDQRDAICNPLTPDNPPLTTDH